MSRIEKARGTFLLARTKLKTRRVRLLILLVTMSLLFTLLVSASELATGFINSAQKFGKEGLGSRYLIQATPYVYFPFSDNELITQLKSKQDQLIAHKVALAKKLNISYDAKSDSNLYYANVQNGPSSTDLAPLLNQSILGNDALNSQNLSIPGIGFTDFSSKAKKAGAINVFRSNAVQNQPATSNLSVIINGKETFSATTTNNYNTAGVSSIQSLGWHQMSDELLKPFLLDGQSTTLGTDSSIPIIAPYTAAEQIAGLSELPSNATPDQKLLRLVQLRARVAGKTAQLCYRNDASASLLQKVIDQQKEISANKNKAGYEKPHLIYGVPKDPCGKVNVVSDTRTDEEITSDTNQKTFDDTFGLPAPVEGIIQIKIAGISPDQNKGESGFSAGSLLSGIVGSSLGSGWLSPTSAITPGSLASQAQNGSIDEAPVSKLIYYAEFSNLRSATNFIKSNNCVVNLKNNFSDYNPNSTVKDCVAKNTPFAVTAFGNNAGAISDIKKGAWKFLRYVLIVIDIIAAIIMMGTFGKVIADSRRETAVFRSLGATRYIISQIYLTYTFMVCCMVAAASVVFGTLITIFISQHASPSLSINAVLIYNAKNVHEKFTLVGFNVLYIASIFGLIFMAGLISAVIPLATNMRRNPIKDMRDE